VVSIILCQYQFAQFTISLDIVYRLDIVYMQCDCHCFFIKGYLTWLDIIPMGASRDFLTFFPAHLWRSDPQPILTQNGSNDVHPGKDDTFAVLQ